MEDNIFILYHEYEDESGYFEQKILGIYSSKGKASSSILKFKNLEGFKSYPNGFYVEESSLNEENISWKEGFCHKKWVELDGIPYFVKRAKKDKKKINDILKEYYKLNSLPNGPGSELKKIRCWEENNEE